MNCLFSNLMSRIKKKKKKCRVIRKVAPRVSDVSCVDQAETDCADETLLLTYRNESSGPCFLTDGVTSHFSRVKTS